jgi:mannan polymerase II complex MNN11 subunit
MKHDIQGTLINTLTNPSLQEHVVQWHPTILSKLAIVPQRVLNSYSTTKDGELYQEGDLVVRFAACTHDAGDNNCVDDAKRYVSRWRKSFDMAR